MNRHSRRIMALAMARLDRGTPIPGKVQAAIPVRTLALALARRDTVRGTVSSLLTR
ncbi:hypothetical protein [Phenylobacterium sp.]|uniref:hypothetical protein n=1 Tax=Phenylobacterium sp. TaxID=1871053 RepID=UPI0027378967|nr:hypothetical protein [Phenylobacterium sp.]MDP3869900.1 hypothetical protein [Phenylobacterium sp.]